MAFLDVITLAEAKNYLRIDEDLTEDDVRLSSMIKTALHTIEWRTNVLLYSRNKEYLVQDYCVSVYDYQLIVWYLQQMQMQKKRHYTLIIMLDHHRIKRLL